MTFERISLLHLAVITIMASATVAPSQSHNDFQSWNDVQLTTPMSTNVDFFVKITMRLGKNVTRSNDGRFAVGFVHKPLKSVTVSPFYWYINARNATGQFRIERRLNLSAIYRFPIKRFGLTDRSTFENRMRAVNTWRYRPSLTFENDIPKKIIPGAKFFVADETFYDSVTRKFSRNRFSIGTTKTVNKNLSVDIYYMRKNDHFAFPGDLNTVWTPWKTKL